MLRRRTRFLLTLLAAAVLTTGVMASPYELMFTDVVPDAGSRGGPAALSWNHDGTRLAYLYDDGDGAALWVLESGGDVPRRRFGDDGLADGIDAFHWSPVDNSLLLESAGDFHLLPAAAQQARPLTRTGGEAADPAFSPDGTHLAFVRDHDLHVLNISSGDIRRLTSGGAANTRLNGEADWVYWEEIWGRDATAFWWSPDSRRIAFYSFDETPVQTYPLVDTTSQYPRVRQQKYPKAGTANPGVRIGVVPVRGGKVTWMDTGRDEDVYLARVHWKPESRGLVVERLNREQDRLDLLQCDARRGRCRKIFSETWPTWINLGNDFSFLADGSFIRGSARSGWRRLDLHAADGRRMRSLTPEGWAVTSLDGVDEKRGWIVVTGFRSDEPAGARERHVLRVSLDEDAGLEMFTQGRGWSSALVAPVSGAWVLTESDANTPTRRTVRGPGIPDAVEMVSGPPLPYAPETLPQWEFVELPGDDGVRLPGMMLKPDGFDPAQRYPVIMYHYGGPGSQVVTDRWGGRGRSVWHRMMAQQGYVVFSVDNPASLFFGKRGEDLQHRRFGEINLAAQKAAVRWLKSQRWVDGERIGLWGWSGGGTNTLYCLFNAPGIWKAGMAGAPVTDWNLYDTIWTERYLDHPSDNRDGYQASSPLTHAGHLEDALLIIHGTGDDNVHPQNTLNLIDALVASERMFEVALYPGQKHGFSGLAARHFYRRMTEFFQRHLGETQRDGSSPE